MDVTTNSEVGKGQAALHVRLVESAMFRTLWTVFVVALCSLCSVSARAQGQITALQVTPSPAQPGDTVSISIYYVGNCTGGVTLDFGDGSPPAQFDLPTLAPATHTYNQPATLKVSADFSLNPTLCSGQAIAALPISNQTGPMRYLYCTILGCNPAISSMPFSNVTPGGQIIILGSGFGSSPGKVRMVLESYNQNQMIWDIPVAASDWSSGLVIATIPPDIEIVGAQPASFQIITSGSSWSNGFPLPFRPTLQILAIDQSRVACRMSVNSPSDDCQGAGGFNVPAECAELAQFGTGSSLGFVPPGYTANHGSGWQLFNTSNSDNGMDTFSISPPLQNGWVNAGGATFSSFATDGSSHANLWAPISNAPVSSLSWQVGWSVDACAWVGYSGDIFIIGPAGMPY